MYNQIRADCERRQEPQLAELAIAVLKADLQAWGHVDKNGQRRGVRHEIDPWVLKYAVATYQRCGSSEYANLRRIHPGLPAISSIQRYRSRFHYEPGFKRQVLQIMREDATRRGLSGWERNGMLTFDAMVILEDVVYCPRRKAVIGLVGAESNPLLEEVKRMGTEASVKGAAGKGARAEEAAKLKGSIATSWQEVWWTSLGAPGFSFPVYQCATQHLAAPEIRSILTQVIHEVSSVCGLRTVLLVCDGAAEHRTLIKRLAKHGLHSEEERIKIAMDTPGRPDLPIFFSSDFSHAIKKLVNSLESSGEGPTFQRQIRMRVKNPSTGEMEWQLLSLGQLHGVWTRAEKEVGPCAERGFAITDFKKTAFHRMRVAPAMRVLGPKMQRLLEREKTLCETGAANEERQAAAPQNEAMLHFVRETSKVLEIFQNPRLQLSGGARSEQHLSTLENFCVWMEEWRSEVMGREDVAEKELSKHFFTNQAFDDIICSIRGLVGCVKFYLTDERYGSSRYIIPHMCTQDALEHHFGVVRSYVRHGRLTATTVSDVTRCSIVNRAIGALASKKSNVAGMGSLVEEQLYRPSLGYEKAVSGKRSFIDVSGGTVGPRKRAALTDKTNTTPICTVSV